MSEINDSEQDVSQDETIVKRSRGRPKKPVVIKLFDETPPKRGRPRKPISNDPPPPPPPKPPREYKWKNDPETYAHDYYRNKLKCEMICEFCNKTCVSKYALTKHQRETKACHAVKEKLMEIEELKNKYEGRTKVIGESIEKCGEILERMEKRGERIEKCSEILERMNQRIN